MAAIEAAWFPVALIYADRYMFVSVTPKTIDTPR